MKKNEQNANELQELYFKFGYFWVPRERIIRPGMHSIYNDEYMCVFDYDQWGSI